MPYFMHLYLLMAMRAIAVHIFFSAVAIIDISAVRHCNLINPIIEVLGQGLYFLHFPVYASLNHCMLLLKSLLQNHVLRLPDFCIPTSLYPFILPLIFTEARGEDPSKCEIEQPAFYSSSFLILSQFDFVFKKVLKSCNFKGSGEHRNTKGNWEFQNYARTCNQRHQ